MMTESAEEEEGPVIIEIPPLLPGSSTSLTSRTELTASLRVLVERLAGNAAALANNYTTTPSNAREQGEEEEIKDDDDDDAADKMEDRDLVDVKIGDGSHPVTELDGVNACTCSVEEGGGVGEESLKANAGSILTSKGGLATCLICYDDIALQEKLPKELEKFIDDDELEGRKRGGSPCPHSYCPACIKAYLETRVNSGLTRYPCPLYGEDGCDYAFREDHLLTLVDEALYLKHLRFTAMRADPQTRECPSCHHLMKGSKRKPTMICRQCNSRFCYFHSNAHPDSSCRRYSRQIRSCEKASKNTVRKISKPCPRCKAPIQKDGGCNHISCLNCRFEWCWICDQRYTPMHYSPTNIFFGCPGAQFIDFSGCCCGMSGHFCRLMRLCLALLLLPLPLTLGLIVAILTSLLWLPIGLTWIIIGLFQPHLLRCIGGNWNKLDLLFPLIAGSRGFRESHGPLSTFYVFLFMGATPIILSIALVLEVAWLPIALVVCLIRLIRKRRIRPSFIFAPLIGATAFLDLDGE